MSSSCPTFNSGGVQYNSQLFTPPINTNQYQPVFYSDPTPNSFSLYNDNLMSPSGKSSFNPPSCSSITFTYNTVVNNTKIGLINELTLGSNGDGQNINYLNSTTAIKGNIQSIYVPPNMVVVITDNINNKNVSNVLCLIGTYGTINLNDNISINDSDFAINSTSNGFTNNVSVVNIIADGQQSNYGVIPIESGNWINTTNPIYINFCYKCFYNSNPKIKSIVPLTWDYYLALGCTNLIFNDTGLLTPYISGACSNSGNAKTCDNIVSKYCNTSQGKKDNIVCGCYNSIANSSNTGKPIACASGICGPTSSNYVPSQFRCIGCTDVIFNCKQNIIENGSGSVNIGTINMSCDQIAGVKEKTTTNIISNTFNDITNFISTHIYISLIGFLILLGFIIIIAIIIIKKKQLKNQNIPTII